MTDKSITVGVKRLEYLDIANKSYSAGDYDSMESYIEDFLFTIQENSKADGDLKTRFKDIDDKIKKTITDKEAEIINSKVSINEATDQLQFTKNYAGIKGLKEKLNACWQVALINGLFHE